MKISKVPRKDAEKKKHKKTVRSDYLFLFISATRTLFTYECSVHLPLHDSITKESTSRHWVYTDPCFLSPQYILCKYFSVSTSTYTNLLFLPKNTRIDLRADTTRHQGKYASQISASQHSSVVVSEKTLWQEFNTVVYNLRRQLYSHFG